jgi:hypothetical protein
MVDVLPSACGGLEAVLEGPAIDNCAMWSAEAEEVVLATDKAEGPAIGSSNSGTAGVRRRS